MGVSHRHVPETIRTVSVYIPARTVVPKTDDEDPIDYYYRPITGTIYRSRLAMSVSLLGSRTYDSLLEIGYGSGVLLPELARHADRIAGIDLHDCVDAVHTMLRGEGVSADLRTGSLFELPFDDGTFDAVVSFSVFEHLTELDAALREVVRVLRPGGRFVAGFPVRNLVTDAFFRWAGYDPRAIHPSSHSDIERAIRRAPGLQFDRRRIMPAFLPADFALYEACTACKLPC